MSFIPDALKPDTERVAARLLCAVSSRMPARVHDKWVAPDSPAYVRLNWRVAVNTVDSVKDWAEVKDIPRPDWPTKHASAVIISMERDVIDEYLDMYGGNPAVAYSIGSTIVAATLPGQGFGNDTIEARHFDAPHYDVGLVIFGKNVLRAAGGVLRDDNRFEVPLNSMHVSPREVLVSEFPEDVPLACPNKFLWRRPTASSR